MRRFTAAALLLGFLTPAPAAAALSVEEAYREMQHRHAALDLSKFPPQEAAYLKALFELVDLAIVENVQTWAYFQSEGKRGASFRDSRGRVDALIARIDALPAPPALRDVHRLMVEVVRDQRGFFAAWQQALDGTAQASAGGGGSPRSQLLESSSRKLHEAYARLLQIFPAAGQQNFDAFYDHLCVLDLL